MNHASLSKQGEAKSLAKKTRTETESKVTPYLQVRVGIIRAERRRMKQHVGSTTLEIWHFQRKISSEQNSSQWEIRMPHDRLYYLQRLGGTPASYSM
jgi:hypothetical protein